MPNSDVFAQRAAEAKHANQRLALYQQRVDTGRGDLRQLAELQRIADGANRRLRLEREGRRAVNSSSDLMEALRDVDAQLEAPTLTPAERNALLRRQAELGDLRDEIQLRRRRDHPEDDDLFRPASDRFAR